MSTSDTFYHTPFIFELKNKTSHLNTLLYDITTKFVENLPIIARKKNKKKFPTRWSPNGKSEI
jgi:hypothetical protein